MLLDKGSPDEVRYVSKTPGGGVNANLEWHILKPRLAISPTHLSCLASMLELGVFSWGVVFFFFGGGVIRVRCKPTLNQPMCRWCAGKIACLLISSCSPSLSACPLPRIVGEALRDADILQKGLDKALDRRVVIGDLITGKRPVRGKAPLQKIHCFRPLPFLHGVLTCSKQPPLNNRFRSRDAWWFDSHTVASP